MLKNNKSNKKNKNTGITLIALVITIIVMMILVSVTVQITINGGLFEKSKEAVLKMEMAEIVEKIDFIAMEQSILNNTQAKKTTIRYLLENNLVGSRRIIKTDKLLGEKTKFGNGDSFKDGDVYVICGNKLVYFNKNGEAEIEMDIYLETLPFVTEWNVNDGDVLQLPISTGYIGDNDFIVDWGDGSALEYVSDMREIFSTLPEHKYEKAGTYYISISGRCPYFTSSTISEEQRLKLIRIVSWGDIEAKRYSFSGCYNLGGSVPSPNTYTFTNYGDDASYMFADTAITSIPGDLYKNISEETIFFDKMFSYCNSLTEIPEELFDECENAESFERVFNGCENIKSIPINLFDNCHKATNFKEAFRNMKNIKEAPSLWLIEREGIVGTDCYYGCTQLSNIDEIPDDWK